jgi:predicted PurR-regulated permease PerM
MSLQTRIAYGLMALLLVLVAWLHLGTLILTSLFGYFAIRQFSFGRSRWLGLGLYVVAVTLICYGLIFFVREAYREFPKIAEQTIPEVVAFAEQQKIELPFTDYASLKTMAVDLVSERLANVGRYAWRAGFELASFIIGLVVAVSLFLNARWDLEHDPHTSRDSLYATVVSELVVRVRTFYASFARVIGAQILISTINTGLTAVFLIYNGFKFTTVLIMATFLCGLLPIIGNIISNTLITFVAFTISPKMALIALSYLVIIHKLEYFLNSKIIGDRIKNPMWLTLLGIVLGERLMGIPGMILAPVVLHYIKVEASRAKVAASGAVESFKDSAT